MLSDRLTHRVLAHLQVGPAAPDLALLDRLLYQYGQTVPWESASRIVKRARTSDLRAAPRWSEEFWEDALQRGTGGTCFESNYAFQALLDSLGYQSYLTINDMSATVGCHTAIVVRLDERSWLVDAGYPIYVALPLDPQRETERATPAISYRVEPVSRDRYVISNWPHPRPYMFDLVDRPVDQAAYRAATTNDYGPDGLFLDQLVLRKLIDGTIWRFDSAARPYQLEQFRAGSRTTQPLDDAPAAALSRTFGIEAGIVEQALRALEHKHQA